MGKLVRWIHLSLRLPDICRDGLIGPPVLGGRALRGPRAAANFEGTEAES